MLTFPAFRQKCLNKSPPLFQQQAERREQGDDLRSVLCATVRGKWEEIWREAQSSDEVMVYLTDWVGGTLQDWGIYMNKM